MTNKAIESCNIKPQCKECKKYTPEHIEKHFWSCDKTCKHFKQNK